MSAGSTTVEIMKVTPAQATEWLECNEVNRSLRSSVVNAYRRDMEAGRWAFTGEPIQLSRTGRLLNGQHRLSALAGSESVEHLDFVVITGMPDETQAMMDQGAVRSIRDALVLTNGPVKNVSMVSAVARWAHLCPELGPQLTPKLLRTKVTTAEALEALAKNPEIPTAAERAQALRPTISGSPTAVAFSWLHMHRLDAEACTEFFAGMMDMEWSFKEDPRKAALRRLQIMGSDPAMTTGKETAVMIVSVLSRAWNAWRKGEAVDSFNIRSRSGIILPVTLVP